MNGSLWVQFSAMDDHSAEIINTYNDIQNMNITDTECQWKGS